MGVTVFCHKKLSNFDLLNRSIRSFFWIDWGDLHAVESPMVIVVPVKSVKQKRVEYLLIYRVPCLWRILNLSLPFVERMGGSGINFSWCCFWVGGRKAEPGKAVTYSGRMICFYQFAGGFIVTAGLKKFIKTNRSFFFVFALNLNLRAVRGNQ